MKYLNQIHWYDWTLLAIVLSLIADVIIRGD